MTFRFIHTSDLHLGRRFATIPEAPDGNVRGRLMEARHASIGRIAAGARAEGALHVLVAGDTFDTATPSQHVVKQALASMADDPGIHWWVLPGNHDNLREAEPLWDAIRSGGPSNVTVISEGAPIDLAQGATLLPCPVEWRSSGTDLTVGLTAMESGEGALRIALAHGGVVDFNKTGANIPPDRERTARLDYLALGDWHGRIAVSERTHYSGSPELDRFKRGGRGVCLSVTLDGPGALPRVSEVETGAFLWTEADLQLTPRQDAAAGLQQLLPATGRRDTLMRISAAGWACLPDQVELRRAAERVAPEFAFFDLRTEQLGTQYETADLDEIDRGGALRLAAETLQADAGLSGLPAHDRDIAADALARLYAYMKEDAQ
jgi:hypothetical protein